jgi:hypothetical protein
VIAPCWATVENCSVSPLVQAGHLRTRQRAARGSSLQREQVLSLRVSAGAMPVTPDRCLAAAVTLGSQLVEGAMMLGLGKRSARSHGGQIDHRLTACDGPGTSSCSVSERLTPRSIVIGSSADTTAATPRDKSKRPSQATAASSSRQLALGHKQTSIRRKQMLRVITQG